MGTFADMKNKVTEKAHEFKEKVKSSSFGEKLSSLKDKFLDTKVGQFVSDKLSFFKSKQKEASEFALTDEQKDKLYGKSDIDVQGVRNELVSEDSSYANIAGVGYTTTALKSASGSYDKIGYDTENVMATVSDLVEYHDEIASLDKNSESFDESVDALKEKYGKDTVKLYDKTVSDIEKYNNNKNALLAKGVNETSSEYKEFLEKNYKVAYGVGDMSEQDFNNVLAKKKLACVGLTEEQYDGKAAIDVDEALAKFDDSTQTSNTGAEAKKEDTAAAPAMTPSTSSSSEKSAANDETEQQDAQEKIVFKRPSEEEIAKTVKAFDKLREWTEEHAVTGEDGATSYDTPIGSSEEYMNTVHEVGSLMKNAGIKCDAYNLTDVCLSKSSEEIKKYFDTAFDVEESFSKIIEHAQAANNYTGGFNTDRAIVESSIEQDIKKIKEIYPDLDAEDAENKFPSLNGRSVYSITSMVMAKGADEASEYLHKALGFYTTDTEESQINDPLKKTQAYQADLGIEITEEQMQKICDLTTAVHAKELGMHEDMYNDYLGSIGSKDTAVSATREEFEAAVADRYKYLQEIFGDDEILVMNDDGTEARQAPLYDLAESMLEQHVDLNLDNVPEDTSADELNEYIANNIVTPRGYVDDCVHAVMDSCGDFVDQYRSGDLDKFLYDDTEAETKADAEKTDTSQDRGAMAEEAFGDIVSKSDSAETELENS